MERVQQGLLAAGGLLFVVGVTITLGPATGFLGGVDDGSTASGNATPVPSTDSSGSAGEPPASTPDGDSMVEDDVDLDDDSGDGGGEEGEQDGGTSEEGDGRDNGEEGNERDRGNGKKRGHDGGDGEESAGDLDGGIVEVGGTGVTIG